MTSEDQQASKSGLAVVIGAAGAIGAALCEALESGGGYAQVLRLSRSGEPGINLLSEASIEGAAAFASAHGEIRLVINAAGFLHDVRFAPERSWRDIDPQHMREAFAINAIGPALVMKHFLSLLPRHGRATFATLSAKVGSIGDNRLGGWHSYRASKAALNQLVRTAAIELKRVRPQAICVALHPGAVNSKLSAPFAKTGLNARAPEEAARDLLRIINALTPEQSGGFFDYSGAPLPW